MPQGSSREKRRTDLTDRLKAPTWHLTTIAALVATAAFWSVALAEQEKFSSPPLGAGIAGNWAHFLGPNYNGVPHVERFDPKGIPQVWSQELGPGCSSVSIVDGKLYAMGNLKDQDVVYCLDAKTGEKQWTFAYDCGLMPVSYEGGPGCTPTVADGRVYTVSRKGQIHCLDSRNGKKIWVASVEKWAPKGAWWGFNDSPIIWEDSVFLNVTDRAIALNRVTGEILWSGQEAVPAYATILPLPRGNPVLDRPALAVQTCTTVDIVDPDSGASLLGEAPDWAKRRSNCNAVTPAVFKNSLIFMHARYGLSKISLTGGKWVEDWLCKDLVYHEWDWFTFNQQVIHNGHLFALAGRGTKESDRMMCVDLETGAVKWQKPAPFGNLILAAGKLITVTELGEVAWGVLEGVEYHETFRQKLLSGRNWSHPVLHDGYLYVRSNGGLLTCSRFD